MMSRSWIELMHDLANGQKWIQLNQEERMAKSCKFCYYLNSFTCGDPVDCMGCGRCLTTKEEEK